METVMQRITTKDLARLTDRATKNHRTNVQEISAMLDKLEQLEADPELEAYRMQFVKAPSRKPA